jgi:hypothetical protein
MSADASNTVTSALVNTQLAFQTTEDTCPDQKALSDAAFISPDFLTPSTRFSLPGMRLHSLPRARMRIRTGSRCDFHLHPSTFALRSTRYGLTAEKEVTGEGDIDARCFEAWELWFNEILSRLLNHEERFALSNADSILHKWRCTYNFNVHWLQNDWQRHSDQFSDIQHGAVPNLRQTSAKEKLAKLRENKGMSISSLSHRSARLQTWKWKVAKWSDANAKTESNLLLCQVKRANSAKDNFWFLICGPLNSTLLWRGNLETKTEVRLWGNCLIV